MALTADEEAAVRTLLADIDNSEAITDLPEVGDSSPFNLLVEVLDKTDNTTKQAAIAAMLPYIEEQLAYGASINNASSSKLATRLGSSALHKSLPIHNRIAGCLVNDNGDVVEYLNPSSWLGHDRSGARGQVMIEIPSGYFKFATDTTGNIISAMFSEYYLPGYLYFDKFYWGAYEGSIQRSGNKLCSVVNTSVDYRGGSNNAAYDGTYRSFLGRPATNISLDTSRTYARNRKSGSTEWNAGSMFHYNILYWLYVVEFANRDCQAAVNAQLTSEGYRQGGLGNGVTTLTSAQWTEFNGNYPFVPCGHTDSLGNGTGEVAYTMLNSSGGVFATVNVPRWRGMENPFGHIWEWRDGVIVDVRTSDYSGNFAGQSRVFVAKDPANFASPSTLANSYAGYEMRGLEARTGGYMTKAIFGKYGDIIPSAVGGSDSTYYCDYHYTNVASSSIRGAFFGGSVNNGSDAGLAFAYSASVPSTSSATFGARLCFIPAE